MADTYSLSGLQQMDPSGSTPQPAPLSGLPLAQLFSGAGGDEGISGGAKGAMGGPQGGPGLDFFQLMAAMQGGGDQAGLMGPNLSSLFASIGQGGILGGAGLGTAFGQAGGLSQPSGTAQTAGPQGASGSVDPLQLLREALGLGKAVVGGIAKGASGGSEQPVLDPTGYSLTGDGASPGVPQGSLVSPFLNDPTIDFLFSSGAFTGSPVDPSVLQSLGQQPDFLAALLSGREGPSGLQYQMGGLGADTKLWDPTQFNPSLGAGSGGAGGAGFDWGALTGALGAGQGGIGLAQSAQQGNPMGMLSNLYKLYSGVNQLGDLGGPTFQSVLSDLLQSSGAGDALGAATPYAGPIISALISGLGSGNMAKGLTSGALQAGTQAAFAGSSAAAAPISAGVAAMIMPALENLFGWDQGQGAIPSKLHETSSIRNDFQNAWPAMQSAGPLWDQWSAIGAMDPQQQITALEKMRAEAFGAQNAIPAVSHFTSTQGGRHGGISGGLGGADWGGVPGLDVSGIEQLTPDLYMKSILEQMGAADALANRGQQVSPMGGYGSDPQQLLGLLAQQAGLPGGLTFGAAQPGVSSLGATDPTRAGYQPYGQSVQEDGGTRYYLTPEETTGMTAPGQSLRSIHDLFARFNPQIDQSGFGQAYDQLLPFLMMPT